MASNHLAESPGVSIVTPSFNQAPYLEAAMKSVLDQDYPNVEYLVIDGGSTDGSIDLIKRNADKLAYWVSERDRGQTDAINKGFAQATGKYLAWLNADDHLNHGAVGEAVDFLENHPDVGMVYGDASYIDSRGRVVGRFPAAQTDYAALRRGYVHIPQQAAFWRRDLWLRVAPLDPSFTFAMDYDLWVRLAKISKLHYLPRPWAQFRLHQDSKTLKNDQLAWDEMLRVHWREGGSWLSIIVAKYWLRRVVAPLIHARRWRMLKAS
ncbi:MAG TPA: glycosyltransferase family 2 protein [Anaerolineales bacterium]|nr:glycosyltransferase family 2 protein [Anaerolineales bacterium]